MGSSLNLAAICEALPPALLPLSEDEDDGTGNAATAKYRATKLLARGDVLQDPFESGSTSSGALTPDEAIAAAAHA